MRAPIDRSRRGITFNMTPMIDVVFLLIVFFLVSSNLAQTETQVELELPDATSGERVTPDEQTRRLVINVLDEGHVLVGSQRIETQGLESLLAFERERSSKPLEIRIRTNRDVPYRVFEPILVACARARVWNVSWSVTKKSSAN